MRVNTTTLYSGAGVVLVGSIALLAYLYRDKVVAAATAVKDKVTAAAATGDKAVDSVVEKVVNATSPSQAPVMPVGGADADKLLAFFGQDTTRYQTARFRAIQYYNTSSPSADQIIEMDSRKIPSEIMQMSNADLLAYAGGNQADADMLKASAGAALIGQNFDISQFKIDSNGDVVSGNAGGISVKSALNTPVSIAQISEATPWYVKLALPPIGLTTAAIDYFSK